MHLENKTDENIFVFAGIFVPGRGTLPVELDADEHVRKSPLIAAYISCGELVLHENPGALSTVVETKVEDKVKDRVETKTETLTVLETVAEKPKAK